jgi:hypothetical protein
MAFERKQVRRINNIAAIYTVQYATLYGFEVILRRLLCEHVPVDAKKSHNGRGRGEISPLILNLPTRGLCLISLTDPFIPRKKDPVSIG